MRLSEAACWQIFVRMFPGGLEDPAIARDLPPGKWRDLPRPELADAVGCCLWDVFSNNHDVLTTGGAVVDLDSFRASAGFIADFRSYGLPADRQDRPRWDYMDFYMGAVSVEAQEAAVAIYDLIFSRMRNVELDWRYVHPRLYLIDFHDRSDGVESRARAEFDDYDPSASVARDLERRRRTAELEELRALLDADYRRSVAEARAGPPPPVVRAYQRVYGRLPHGWPPDC